MNTLASGARPATPVWPALWRRVAPLAWPLGGIAVMLFVWWLGGLYLAGNPDTLMFANFAPAPPSPPCGGCSVKRRCGTPSAPAFSASAPACSGAR